MKDEGTPQAPNVKMASDEVLRAKLDVLRVEHRDLDEAIHALVETSGDPFTIRRLKKYKLGLKDKLPTISEKEALDLLHGNGNLIKRPFLIGANFNLVGFKEEIWESAFT